MDIAVLQEFRSRWKIVGLVATWDDAIDPVVNLKMNPKIANHAAETLNRSRSNPYVIAKGEAVYVELGSKVSVSWKRVYRDGVTSDIRGVSAPTFEQAIRLAISWEETNDKKEPENA